MNTPTPRTDAATYPADCLGQTLVTNRDLASTLEIELTALTIEVARLKRDYEYDHKCLHEVRERCESWKQRAMKAEAERDQLRAEVERLRSDRDCEKRLRKDADEFRENAIARAERAEDNLAALEQCHDDNCRGVVKIADELATERARLDWLESDAGVDWQWSSSALTIRRTVIDAAMKEDAK